MKKIIFVIIAIIIIVLAILMLNKPKDGFEIKMGIEGNEKNIQVEKEFVYTIDTNETVIACNFNITYDKDVFEFIEADTAGLNAAENGDVVSCIYADLAGKGTNKLKIKFKAIKEVKETSIGITNAKFRGLGKDVSYVEKDIQGYDKSVKLSIMR